MSRVDELGVVLTAFFIVVVAVAGGSAAALLVWPSRSDAYFSWDLGASPAAATIGGLYLSSVIVFGYALTRPRSETLPLSYGVLALAVSTLVFTATQHDVFDWDRPQATAWVILFVSAPISTSLDLRRPTRPNRSPEATPTARTLVAHLALAAGLLAGAMWFDPTRTWLSARNPIPLVGLTGRYLGAWCAFVSVTAATASVRGRRSDMRFVGVLVGSISIGLLAATARTWRGVGPHAPGYVVGLLGIGALAATLLVEPARRQPPTLPTDRVP